MSDPIYPKLKKPKTKKNWLNIANAIVLPIVLIVSFVSAYNTQKTAQQAKQSIAQNQVNTMEILLSQKCLGSFFLLSGTTRSSSNLNALVNQPACAATIRDIEQKP